MFSELAFTSCSDGDITDVSKGQDYKCRYPT